MSSGRSALRRCLVTVAAVAISAAVLSPPATAAPTQQAAPDQTVTPKPLTLPGLGAGDHTITLISGDTVKLIDQGDGTFAWSARPATRPDGRIPLLRGRSEPGHHYLVPEDAEQAIAAGVLDRALFDIQYLAEHGYTDERTDELPVIAQYPATTADNALRARADALPASTPAVTLESINATGLAVSKAKASTFWQSVTAGPRTLAGGLTRLWLDKKMAADLADSVPLIGAPDTWADGYDGTGTTVAVLDTGVDKTHPDLAGKVVAERSFVGTDNVLDGNGHGTHVAATVAGTGAGSDPARRGVAPGAQLMIGKVLGDSGFGSMSGVIDGMEWAATNGADVVSLSLGSDPTDGTDPASQAVDDLTASTGALFVIAAGNSGPSRETVDSPGAADAALTVAATSKTDSLASFSSRGPRLDYALKPDIAAPGVDIVAARAAGTSLGNPVDDRYTSASGTSMATPHVAGAAAILAQAHPDWTAAEYKAALMSTSKDAGFSVYEQGAGRVDVARAVGQQVYALSHNVDFGSVEAGQPPSTKELTYTNHGDRPVTLTLSASMRDAGGDPVRDGGLSVPGTVTVPAGGTETVTVTADTAPLGDGYFSGTVVATADDTGVRVSTPVSVVRQPPGVLVELTVPNLPSESAENGTPQVIFDIIDLTGGRGPLNSRIRYLAPDRARAVLPDGTYHFAAAVHWNDVDLRTNFAYLLKPEVTISGETTVSFDGRQARKLTFSSPRGPLEQFPSGIASMQVERTVQPWEAYGSWTVAAPFHTFWLNPTRPVTKGKLMVGANLDLGHPEVEMRVTSPRGSTLHPVNYPHYGDELNGFGDYRHFTGKQTLELVDVGHGHAEDIAGLDLRGKLALLDNDQPCHLDISQVHDLRDAGAAGLLAWTSTPQNVDCGGGPIIPIGIVGPPDHPDQTVGIPYTSIPPAEARSLLGQLARGPVSISVTGTPESPYRYSAQIREGGRVPASLHFPLGARQVLQVNNELHGTESTRFDLLHGSRRPDQWVYLVGGPPPVVGASTQALYIGPLYDQVEHQVTVTADDETESQRLLADRSGRTLLRWNTGSGLKTPGPMPVPAKLAELWDTDAEPGTQNTLAVCHFCRQVDAFAATFGMVNGDGRTGNPLVAPGSTRLYRDGVEVPIGKPFTFPFTLPREKANYRLTLRAFNNDVEWTFSSATVTKDGTAPGVRCATEMFDGRTGPCRPEPLVFVAYDLGRGQALDNTVRAGKPHVFRVDAYHALSGTAMPRTAGLKLWTSTDDGRTWKSAKVWRRADGSYTVMAVYPRFAATSGTVSLRARAWDTAGNRVVQTTMNAFPLTDKRIRGGTE